MATTEHDDELVLRGPLARWITDRAHAEGRGEAEVVAEALALRWGAELGDAFRDLWQASDPLTEGEAEEIVEAEIYRPRQEGRRAG